MRSPVLADSIPQKDLIVSAIVPPETPGAMQTGAVDGASVGPPVIEQVTQDQGAVIVANGTTANPVDPPWLTHVDANVILVKKQTCVDHKSLCVKMGQALVKAAAFIHDHPKETTEMLGKRTRITDQKVLDGMYKVTLESTRLRRCSTRKVLRPRISSMSKRASCRPTRSSNPTATSSPTSTCRKK